MIICIFGESCSGKTTIADRIEAEYKATCYTGKDYLKMEKNEQTAVETFKKLLFDHEKDAEMIIFVVNEIDQLELIPGGAKRILVTAQLETIKERFSARTHGALPLPIAKMLERKHGMFDNIPYDIRIENDGKTIEAICNEVIELLGELISA